MRSAFDEERRRLEERVAAARARLMTHRRMREQRRAGDLLAAGWQRAHRGALRTVARPAMPPILDRKRDCRGAQGVAERRVAYRPCARLAGRRARSAGEHAGNDRCARRRNSRRRRRPRRAQGFGRRQRHRRHARRVARRSCRDRRDAARRSGASRREPRDDSLDRRSRVARDGIGSVRDARSGPRRRPRAAGRSRAHRRRRDRRAGLRGHDRAQAWRDRRGRSHPARDIPRSGVARPHLRRTAAAARRCRCALRAARHAPVPFAIVHVRSARRTRRHRARRRDPRRARRGERRRAEMHRAAGCRGRSRGDRRIEATTRTTRFSPRCATRAAANARWR